MPPQTPYVRDYIARSVEELDGRRWEIGPNSEGGAWYHQTATEFEIATWGVLAVNSVSEDLTVEGEVNLVFPSGRHVWGEFRAIWFTSNRLCG